MEKECVVSEKPEDWPANNREQILETICEKLDEFRDNPSYKTRENDLR